MREDRIYEKLNTARGIAELLSLEDFTPVYRLADRVRAENVGDTVHLRAIIEFSNVCKRRCAYCGLNRENKTLPRYRMTRGEIVEAARGAVAAGYRTIVLQSGEDDAFTAEALGDIIEDIKALKVSVDCDMADNCRVTDGHDMADERGRPPAITISCGERPDEDYAFWRGKGADRYLLKHETADAELYDRLHPCGTLESRVKCLRALKSLGYETGSGFMVGLPGQTAETIGKDLLLLRELDCDMAGIGPFISNPKTPLAGELDGDPELTRRAVAVARLLLPKANLPVTTALSLLSAKEKKTGENPFSFGANVVMKKVTPDEYKKAYEIYPAEFKKTEVLKDRREIEDIIRACGRKPL